jgi:O-antigen ligase
MNATTMTVGAAQTAPMLERVTLALLLGFVGALQVSIAVAQILLAAMVVSWLARHAADRTRPSAPSFFLPLAGYAGLTLVASAFSLDPWASFIDSRQLLLFAIVPAVYDIARGQRAVTVIDVLVSVGAVSAAFGIIQYGVLHYDNLGQRPDGWLTHYMTYSGVLMLVLCAAVGRLVFGSRDRIWPALVLPALVVALVLTSTRSAWIGASAAVGLLLLLKDFRLMALLPIVLAVLFVVAPASFADRMQAAFDDRDPATLDRLAMIEIGGRMIAAHPLTGVGPEMVPDVYEQYRPDYAVNATNPHLHNVPMQIAAERGLPALAVWVWFIGATALALWRLFRKTMDPVLAATGLAVVTAMLAAGLFEYNFGDSEFLMMFLVLVTLPFAAAREAGATDAAAADRA